MLLLTGLAVVAIEAWSSRSAQPQPPTRYIAIALNQVQSRHAVEEIWTEAGQPGRRRGWSVRAVGALLAVLLFAICGRIAIFYRVTKDVECSGPSALVRKPQFIVCAYTDQYRRSFLLSSPSTTASVTPASDNTPPGVLTRAHAHTSTASTASSSTAPPATSFLLFYSPSVASLSSSSPAHCARRTFVPSQTRQRPQFLPFNSLPSCSTASLYRYHTV